MSLGAMKSVRAGGRWRGSADRRDVLERESSDLPARHSSHGVQSKTLPLSYAWCHPIHSGIDLENVENGIAVM